jgi:hypothetical protein
MSREAARQTILDVIHRGQPRSYQSIMRDSGHELWELLDAWNSLRKEGQIPLAKMFVIDWYGSGRDEDDRLAAKRSMGADTRAAMWLSPNPRHKRLDAITRIDT